MSDLIELPKNLIKRPPYIADPKDYSDSVPMSFYPSRLGTRIELPCGEFALGSQEKRLKLLTRYRHIFHFSPPNEIYSLFDKATEEQLIDLCIFGETVISGFFIKEWANAFIISKNGNTTEIINIAPRLKRRIIPSLDGINRAITELIEFEKIFSDPVTLLTPAANASACALTNPAIFSEIKAINRFPLHILDKFTKACLGGIMESTGIGTRYMAGYDMSQCHLNLFVDYPSMINAVLVKGAPYDPNDKDQLPTSIYLVKWEIPEDIDRKLKFRPIPRRTEAGISKPVGTWVDWYYKDYLDLAVWLNKTYNVGIKFKAVDSYVFLDRNPSHPFRDYMFEVKNMIKAATKLFPNIEPRAKYNTLAGSTKSIRRVVDRETLAEKQVASRVFAPIIYGFILSRQTTLDYKRAITKDAFALKVDATEEPMITEEGGIFVFKGDGLGSFLTNYLKSTKSNQNTLWREVIEASKDLPYVEVLQDFYPSIKYLKNPFNVTPEPYLKLGQRYTRLRQIKPRYGHNRTGPDIPHVGVLLNNWLESHYTTDNPEKIEYDLLKIDKFREFFPK